MQILKAIKDLLEYISGIGLWDSFVFLQESVEITIFAVFEPKYDVVGCFESVQQID